MTLHKSQVTDHAVSSQFSYDGNHGDVPCSAEAIFLCCSNFHPLLCLLCTLSSLISLSSDNYHHVNLSCLTTRKPGNDEASLLSHTRAPGIQGSCTAPHTQSRWRHVLVTLELLPSRTDLRGQRWSSVSTCAQHITRYLDLDDPSPSGAT